MEISARNRYVGTIGSLTRGAVNSEVLLDVAGGAINAIVTNGSVDRLALATGKRASALIKASNVLLSVGAEAPVVGVRNILCGEVAEVMVGSVNAEVMVRTADGLDVVATVSVASIKRLGIAPGVAACALFKASSVLLAVV